MGIAARYFRAWCDTRENLEMLDGHKRILGYFGVIIRTKFSTQLIPLNCPFYSFEP
jgi:hypothetical protein